MSPTVAKRARPNPSALTADQQRVLDALHAGRNVLATGPAGVGKTFLIQHVVENARNPGTTFLTATTGVAAVQLGGATLHAFAGIRDGTASLSRMISRIRTDSAAARRWRLCDLLIVDEVSMLDADLLERVDGIARAVRNQPRLPFGGVQLLLTGDFCQLPPVGPRSHPEYAEGTACALPPPCGTPPPPRLAFQSPAWEAIDPVVVSLTTVFRQQRDPLFAAMLAEIRLGRCSEASLETLRTRVGVPPPTDAVVTRLRARCQDVEIINARAFDTMSRVHPIGRSLIGSTTPIHSFTALDEGPDVLHGWTCPAPPILHLRMGSSVLLLKNLDVYSTPPGSERGGCCRRPPGCATGRREW
jgi:ATP-dependent DNA helicase PIF1